MGNQLANKPRCFPHGRIIAMIFCLADCNPQYLHFELSNRNTPEHITNLQKSEESDA